MRRGSPPPFTIHYPPFTIHPFHHHYIRATFISKLLDQFIGRCPPSQCLDASPTLVMHPSNPSSSFSLSAMRAVLATGKAA
ncbi:hypothetical protein IF1G_09459 [Cordyceps javanica]|uniref:Uncharacterized protein n=1 Tax=Cordyceps javanica TaxID=43265 RepID=A0A545UQY4_9HYPO|nr:hypothetical protein IF1G_09459 [Cordyceps javanica]